MIVDIVVKHSSSYKIVIIYTQQLDVWRNGKCNSDFFYDRSTKITFTSFITVELGSNVNDEMALYNNHIYLSSGTRICANGIIREFWEINQHDSLECI